MDEIRRVVTVFRELRDGVTADGRTKLKSPSGTLSTAEAISVVTNGLALAAHFGDGVLRAGRRGRRHPRRRRPRPGGRPGRLAGVPGDGRPRAGRLEGLLPRLPRGERMTAATGRRAPAAGTAGDGGPRARGRCCSGCGTTGPGSARGRCGPRWTRRRPAGRPDRGAARGGRAGPAGRRRRTCGRPVALLAHAVDEPGRAAFWPLAEFSPEWVAIRWALAHGVPVRFIDLPAAHTLAWGAADEDGARRHRRTADGGGTATRPATGAAAADAPSASVRVDPLAVLAEAAGYDDPERWWEDVVEHRGAGGGDDPFAPFAALAEAMGALREAYGDGGHDRDPVREAYMRLQAAGRAAGVRGRRRRGVRGLARARAARSGPRSPPTGRCSRGCPRSRPSMTWVPWTHRRLARASGYGAGIDSPGWYGHLFSAPDRPVERWMTKVAGLLRDEDRPVSSAHVIEAVRLAETLAAMRGRPLAGLTETTDAVRAVMCEGSDVPLALVHDRLVVGDVLGEVPDGRARGAAAARPRPGSSARCGSSPRRWSASWSSTCARRPTRPAAGCCTGCGCSASAGASPAASPRQHRHLPGDLAAALGAGAVGAGRRGRRVGHHRARRRDRQGARRTPSARRPSPRSPRSPSAACSPSCPTRCPW